MSCKFKILFKPSAIKQYEKLDNVTKSKIKAILKKLENNPYQLPYKKLVNFDNLYRVRTGNYRIIYSLFKNELIIEVIKIGKRENIYD